MPADTAIETPCSRVCTLHPRLRLCLGCGRSLDEITRWVEMKPAERSAIMARLPARLSVIRGADATQAG